MMKFILKFLRCFHASKNTEKASSARDGQAQDAHGDAHGQSPPGITDDSLLFPVWPPPNPRYIIAQREMYKERLMQRKFAAPKGVLEDSPLHYLYRIYEWILVGHTINMRNELELFWWKRWPVSNIPDPGEQGDPERYGVLACIPALLVESFNARIDLGLRREEPHSILSLEEQLRWAATPKKMETLPPWTNNVEPLKELLYIPDTVPTEPQPNSIDDPRADPAFKEKNILILRPHIHFI
ncbi:phosphoesterase [Niveomyces insectorum RCEF 264]|uniref:Phosphoesterase n=1 Tax=Niveomyces insectorum RCEF 264 TaxID=1081102 RepID=A0A167MPC3_9HYPO|nr:phosphoesterase [Niveomyces insectorum RCEF 264]